MNLAMFTMYLDDSGTRPSQQVAIANALIIPAAQITQLETEWETLKKSEGFTDFHTSKCVAQDLRSQYANWDCEKVNRVFARVRQISKKYGVLAFSAALKKEYFDEVLPQEYKRYMYGTHYSWCASYVIAFAERWRARGKPILPFEFVFDWLDEGSEERNEICKLMTISERAAKEQGKAGDYEHYNFRRSKEIPGLQCSDAIAWTCFQFAQPTFDPKYRLREIAKTAWEDYEGHRASNGWLRAFTFEKENIQEWLAKEQASGRTLAQFER